ncbi:diguanylate cyclase [Mesorhizobium sp. M1312]|uniref:diguanylate cyclase domain-containing protein n=1 Tax=unclassified Mesorhizobium TaxID=325217 RepID=UPI00333CC7B0
MPKSIYAVVKQKQRRCARQSGSFTWRIAGGRWALLQSFGVAAYPEHGAGWAELTNAADHALYEAKGEGRDRVVVARSGAPGERQIHLVTAPKK